MAQQLQMQAGHRRLPDWSAAVVAGLAAGAILMIVDLIWSTAIRDAGPWQTSRMIAAAILGPQMLESTEYSLAAVVVALFAHYSSGVVFALVVATVIAQFRLDRSAGMSLATGLAFGLALYLFNFYVLVLMFPWFATIRGLPAVIAHLIFGGSAALLYWQFKRSEATSDARA